MLPQARSIQQSTSTNDKQKSSRRLLYVKKNGFLRSGIHMYIAGLRSMTNKLRHFQILKGY